MTLEPRSGLMKGLLAAIGAPLSRMLEMAPPGGSLRWPRSVTPETLDNGIIMPEGDEVAKTTDDPPVLLEANIDTTPDRFGLR